MLGISVFYESSDSNVVAGYHSTSLTKDEIVRYDFS
jgi:hypothetical protein